MSPEQNVLAALPQRLAEAVDYGLLQGLLKYTPSGALDHAPFALTPCPLPAAADAHLRSLTGLFGRLAHRVARDRDFLEGVLGTVARTDPFTALLLELAREGAGQQPLHLSVTRSDYFLHQPQPERPAVLRQVELNTISASYPGLTGIVARLHAHLLRDTPLAPRLAPNAPLPVIAAGFAEAHARYGHSDARVAMVVQPGETNVFDQRLLEFALQERGLVTRRCTLEEIAREGRLREGHLVLRDEIIAIAYLRAAYGPEDLSTEEARQGRRLLAASSAIGVPDLCTQLAGAKKVQQVLTDPAILRRFLPDAEAALVEATFAGQYDLDAPLPHNGGEAPAWRVAMAHPERYVLKPQREGGGHNYFDQALVELLGALAPTAREAYVLMERIRPLPHDALLVRGREAVRTRAVSEIGRFGVYLAEEDAVHLDADAGYLVRTKGHETTEGGVSAGFGFLDSLLLDAAP